MKVDMKNIYQKLGLKNKTCYIFIAVILQIKTPNDKLGLWVFTDTVNNISIVVWQSMLQYLYKNRHVLKGGVEWSLADSKLEWSLGDSKLEWSLGDSKLEWSLDWTYE